MTAMQFGCCAQALGPAATLCGISPAAQCPAQVPGHPFRDIPGDGRWDIDRLLGEASATRYSTVVILSSLIFTLKLIF